MNKRCLTIAIATLVGTGIASAPALAQQAGGGATTAAQSEPQTLQSIQVTGTRIKASSLVTATPVVKVGQQEIQETGLATVGDVLQQLPISGTAINTHNNNAGQMGSPPDGSGIGGGSTHIALRGLTAKRTLVLVDGLRWINGSSGSGVAASPDLNTIPMSAIERIDVLPNGASALYGADAIAGVVNIITKHSQDGASLTGYYGVHDIEGTFTGQTYTGSFSVGGQGDRFRYFVTLESTTANPISSGLWSGARMCVPGMGLAGCSAATPMGDFQFTVPSGDDLGGLCPGGFCNITPNKGLTAGEVPKFPEGFHQFGNADRYNYTFDQQLMMASRRTGGFASASYSITPSTHAYMRLTYSNRTARDRISPNPVGVGPGQCQPGSPDCLAGVDVTNPYNPFGFSLDPTTDPTIIFLRRVNEAGFRRYKMTSAMHYLNAGVTGYFTLWNRDYNWDVNYAHAKNHGTQTGGNVVNSARFIKAIGPLSECQATPGCVPLNLFGGLGTITPEMYNYFMRDSFSRSDQTLGLVTANLSGGLFDLPGGTVNFATGYEHRNLSGTFEPDILVQEGITAAPIPATAGGFHADSVYLEFNAPLLAGVPGATALNIDLASRYDRYSTFGGTTDSQAAIRWQPIEDLTLRAMWGQGFRAPTVGELFGAKAFSSSYVIDPCNFDNPARSAAVLANCRQIGVPRLDTFHQTNIQMSVQVGGNPNLQPERSRSTTIGAVYSPSWATNQAWAQKLDLSVTYYKIMLKDTITAADAQTIVSRCMDALDPTFCKDVFRGKSGQINLIHDTLQNLGRVDTSGFDFNATWTSPDTTVGRFRATLNGTYVKEWRSINGFTGLSEPRTVGVETSNASIPRINAQLRVGWAKGDWSALWTTRYISALDGNCGPAAASSICTEPDNKFRFAAGQRRMGATVYNDVRATWRVPTSLKVTLSGGVNNVFDKRPPACTTCTISGYDSTTYSLPGRFFYANAQIDF